MRSLLWRAWQGLLGQPPLRMQRCPRRCAALYKPDGLDAGEMMSCGSAALILQAAVPWLPLQQLLEPAPQTASLRGSIMSRGDVGAFTNNTEGKTYMCRTTQTQGCCSGGKLGLQYVELALFLSTSRFHAPL